MARSLDTHEQTSTDKSESDTTDDVYAPEIEGKQYRGTWYLPLPYDQLSEAPETDDYPTRGTGGTFRIADLPRVPRVRHIVGPSALMLGASLGSGETLFWPVLIAQHDWTLYWAFIIGVFTQFFINTELQRWTLATGESIFRSFLRVRQFWPWVFLIGGLVSLGWPGWAAGAAQVAVTALGLTGSVSAFGITLANWKLIAIGLMGVIWCSYQISSVMYNAVEAFQITLLFVATGAAILLVFVSNAFTELATLPSNVLNGSSTIPSGMDLAVFLGGLAFAGAGGYLNLSQSLWAREKGYGMGNYQGRVKNPLIGDDPELIERNGFTFRPVERNLRRWRGWWRVIQLEHFLTFVVGLIFVATVLMAVSVRYASGTASGAITMWLVQIAPKIGGLGTVLVFVVLFIALFTTEYAIVESFVRNSADALYETYGRDADWKLSRLFWRLLTSFIVWGILIILLFTAPFEDQEPFFFLVVGAALSGIMMWPYTVLTLIINTTRLPEHLQPGWFRVVALWWASSLYGYFSSLLIGETLSEITGLGVFETTATVLGSAPAGYVIWVVFFSVQTYAIVRSVLGKRRAAGTVESAELTNGLFS